MNRQEFDKLAESKQYAYHRKHYAAVRDIESSLRTAERNIIRDMGKYMPPNVVDPNAWLKLNAGPDALANLRKKAMELPEPQRKSWLSKLDKPSWRAQITNKTALYKRIEMEGLTAQRSINSTLNATLRGAAMEGYSRQMFEVQKGVGMGWSFDLPNVRQADAMARRVLNTKYTANLTKRHNDLIKEQITGGIIAGKSEKDIAKTINENSGAQIWESKRLVRTEITAAGAEGELEALRDMESEFGIKMRYRFYATLDERTCPVCGALDLQDFGTDEAEEGVNKPPMHPNCRCVIQPVIDGETKEEIVRVGRDENGKNVIMPPGMTYAEWKEQFIDAKTEPMFSGEPIASANYVITPDVVDGELTVRVEEKSAVNVNVQTDATGKVLPPNLGAGGVYNMVTPQLINDAFRSQGAQYDEKILHDYVEKYKDELEPYDPDKLRERINSLRGVKGNEEVVKAYDDVQELINNPPERTAYQSGPPTEITKEDVDRMSSEQKLNNRDWERVADYTYGSRPYNAPLQQRSDLPYLEAENVEKIKELETVVSKAELNQPVTVFRGDDIRDLAFMKPGDVKRFNSFTSTSASLSKANDFGENVIPGGIPGLMRIDIPAGKGIALPIGIMSEYTNEAEVLLQRGAWLEYLGTKEVYNRIPIMEFRLIVP